MKKDKKKYTKREPKKKPENIQEELRDEFTKRKLKNYPLVLSYERIGMEKKARQVDMCATLIDYKHYDDGAFKLHSVNFCKDRLCSLCAWRRSLKIFGQVSEVMDKLAEKYAFIFLTLTVRNCSGDELKDNVDMLQKGFATMMDRRWGAAKAFKGYFKALEITHHNEYISALRYHPHLHVIIAVNKSYFTDSKSYVSWEKMIELWRKACHLEYKPSIDVHKIKPIADEAAEDLYKDTPNWKIKKAVAEAAKYTIKPEDVTFGSYEEVDRSVYDYTVAMSGRRCCSWAGVFKEARKELKHDDAEDGDLVHTTTEDKLRKDMHYVIESYQWRIGTYQCIGINEDRGGEDV